MLGVVVVKVVVEAAVDVVWVGVVVQVVELERYGCLVKKRL